MDEYSRLQTLYEIADGATGLGPWLAGRAREEIKRMGYKYPADPNNRFINCETCQTEGRIYTADGNNPDWTDHGICPECNGARVVEVETQPVTLADLS